MVSIGSLSISIALYIMIEASFFHHQASAKALHAMNVVNGKVWIPFSAFDGESQCGRNRGAKMGRKAIRKGIIDIVIKRCS